VSESVVREPTRVPAGKHSDLPPAVVRVVRLAPDAEGKPREALVLRDEAGVLRAYRNLCRHLPVPLDAGSRRFLVAGQLECATHGARYQPADGLCVAGPCIGTRLVGLAVEREGDDLFVLDAGQ
jgi:nitrite reductase/ring-hydroxylating ferredoxin subunit